LPLPCAPPHLALLAWAATTHAQSVETGTVKLADSNIEYFSRGTGEGIVLLPGGTLTVGYLDGLADALAKAGYRVVGINFRGSGKSTGSSKGVTLQTMANDVAGVVKTLKLGPVHMAGNDFGNRVARMFAASHSELTRSVILLAAGGKIQPKPAAAHALQIIFNPSSTDADVLKVMPYLVSSPASTPLKTWWAPPGKTKYLILQGAADQIAPPETGELLKKELGDRATLVNVAGAAHLLPLEQRDATAAHVITFIRQLAASPRPPPARSSPVSGMPP
jgi:pimeloyl-ACP methyl ester carboxylesterase